MRDFVSVRVLFAVTSVAMHRHTVAKTDVDVVCEFVCRYQEYKLYAYYQGIIVGACAN